MSAHIRYTPEAISAALRIFIKSGSSNGNEAMRAHLLKFCDTLAEQAPAAAATNMCKAGEFGCECGRPDTEPCPLPHLGAGRMSPTPKGTDDMRDAVIALLNAIEMEKHNEDIFKGKWKKGSKAWSGEFVEKMRKEAIEKGNAALQSHQRNAP